MAGLLPRPEFLQWPFAADSTGPYLGTLKMGTLWGRFHCWEAKGTARTQFEQCIRSKLLSHVSENSQTLDESDSILNISLFMIGRASDRTKPTILLQSDDKKTRKEAFRLLKESRILKDHLGFEMGHCPLSAEFEGLQPTGGLEHEGHPTRQDLLGSEGRVGVVPGDNMDQPWNEPARVSAAPTHSSLGMGQGSASSPARRIPIYATETAIREGTRLFALTTLGGHAPIFASRRDLFQFRSATAGAFVRVAGHTLLLTVNHFLPGEAPLDHKNADDDEGQSDFEITGLEEEPHDQNAEPELVQVTSRGSQSPKSIETNTAASTAAVNPEEQGTASAYPLLQPRDHWNRAFRDDVSQGLGMRGPADVVEIRSFLCTNIGEVVFSSRSLDYCLIQLNSSAILGDIGQREVKRDYGGLEINDPVLISSTGTPLTVCAMASVVDIMIRVNRSSTVHGRLDGYSSDSRLPKSKAFQSTFSAHLDAALGLGDSGSMVYATETGCALGHVVAANRTGKLAMLVPTVFVLADIKNAVGCKILRLSPVATTDQVHYSHQPSSPPSVLTESALMLHERRMEPGPARSLEEWVIEATPTYAWGSLGFSVPETVGSSQSWRMSRASSMIERLHVHVSVPIRGFGGWLSRSPVRTSRESREASQDDNGSR